MSDRAGGGAGGGDEDAGEAGEVLGRGQPQGEPIVAGVAEVAVGLVLVAQRCPRCGQAHRNALQMRATWQDPLLHVRRRWWLLHCPSVTGGGGRFILCR